jgi:DNA-binding NtrC family response regulator
MSDELKVLIVDDELDFAVDTADHLCCSKDQAPDLRETKLKIELCNTAYYVAEEVKNQPLRWDLIFADVYMPIPSPKDRRAVAQWSAEQRTRSSRDGRREWPTWEYKYSWNALTKEEDPKYGDQTSHGGFHIARAIQQARRSDSAESPRTVWPKLVLMSGRLGPAGRSQLYNLLRDVDFPNNWLDYYDKTVWEETAACLPSGLLQSDDFTWALIYSIPRRNHQAWGMSTVDLAKGFALLGMSLEIQKIRISAKIYARARCPIPILITGSPGTGKTTLAQWMHNERFGDSDRPFVPVNIPGYSPDLIPNEIFGNVKGAFTGAQGKEGLVRAADRGTLFWDEIGDASREVQAMLLDLLRRKKYRRLGETAERESLAELWIAATNRPLEEMKKAREFREDLYGRLARSCIRMPDLRERSEDIVLISEAILQKEAREAGRPVARLADCGCEWLKSQPWRENNIQELENLLGPAFRRNPGDELTEKYLRRFQTTKPGPAPVPVDPKTPLDKVISPAMIANGQVTIRELTCLGRKHDFAWKAGLLLPALRLLNNDRKVLSARLGTTVNNVSKLESDTRKRLQKGKLKPGDLLKSPHLTQEDISAIESFVQQARSDKA